MSFARKVLFAPESELVHEVEWNVNDNVTVKDATALGSLIVTLKGTEGNREFTHVNVPLNDVRLFEQAESAGTFYNQHIKGKYSIYVDPQASELGARALTFLDELNRENESILAGNGRLGKEYLHLDRMADGGKEFTRRMRAILQEFHKLQRGKKG
jgi:hypothetical protein